MADDLELSAVAIADYLALAIRQVFRPPGLHDPLRSTARLRKVAEFAARDRSSSCKPPAPEQAEIIRQTELLVREEKERQRQRERWRAPTSSEQTGRVILFDRSETPTTAN